MTMLRADAVGGGIPRFPGLSPRHGAGWVNDPPPFPFAAHRQHAYFRGRSALWNGLRLLRLHPGDRVLVPAYNCGIEVEVLLRWGLGIDFYPIGPDLRPPPGAIERACRPDTRAVYVIHYFGVPQDLEEAQGLVARAGIPLIEDCALVLCSEARGKPVGATGAVSVFSPTKFLPLPDGGVLVVNRPDLALPPPADRPPVYGTFAKLAALWAQGLERRRPAIGRALQRAFRVGALRVGRPLGLRGTDTRHLEPRTLNWSMSGVSRALLHWLDMKDIVDRRRTNFLVLAERLRGCERASPLISTLPPGCCPFAFPILVEDSERVAGALNAVAIGAAATWQSAHPAIGRGRFPEAEQLRRRVVELPIHQDLREDDMEVVAHGVRAVLERIGAAPRTEAACARVPAGSVA